MMSTITESVEKEIEALEVEAQHIADKIKKLRHSDVNDVSMNAFFEFGTYFRDTYDVGSFDVVGDRKGLEGLPEFLYNIYTTSDKFEVSQKEYLPDCLEGNDPYKSDMNPSLIGVIFYDTDDDSGDVYYRFDVKYKSKDADLINGWIEKYNLKEYFLISINQ